MPEDELPSCRGTDGRECAGPRVCVREHCLEGYSRAIVAPAARPARPSPCDALLDALGDSYESRRLINEFAHHLSITAKDVEDNETAPWKPSQIIDPFQHTRETWAAVTRCPRLAAPRPAGPACSHCGEPFAADSAVTTTPGGHSKPDYLWHLGRAACAEAAAAHHALVQSVGYIVQPDFTPAAPSDPGSSR